MNEIRAARGAYGRPAFFLTAQGCKYMKSYFLAAL
jgi:hypothetical protein